MFEKENNGFDNEFSFVQYFNGRKITELDPIGQEFIRTLYPNINEDKIIKCWRNHCPQKSDIFIRIDGIMKGISIKMGSRNSVHIDTVTNFTSFLLQSGIDKEIINSYLRYHYADGTVNGRGKKRLSVEEISRINNVFNKERLVQKAVERFILRGNNSSYRIDALIYGEPNDFLWITRNDIYKIVSSKKNSDSKAIHFGQLIVQPKTRCLNYNPKYERDRYCVQIKWYSLFDDIIEYLQSKFQESDNVVPIHPQSAKEKRE